MRRFMIHIVIHKPSWLNNSFALNEETANVERGCVVPIEGNCWRHAAFLEMGRIVIVRQKESTMYSHIGKVSGSLVCALIAVLISSTAFGQVSDGNLVGSVFDAT